MSEENTELKTIEATKADQADILKLLRELNKAKDSLVQMSVQEVAFRKQVEQATQRVVDLDQAMHRKVEESALMVGINPKQNVWNFDYNTMMFSKVQ